MAENNIGLEAVFENEDFHKGLQEYNNDIASSSKGTEEAGSSMSAIWEGMASVGAIAFEAIGVGIAAMTAELYLAVDAALDAEEVMARVNFVVDNVSERTGVTAENVSALATSLSQVLPIDDEVLASAIAMGLTFDGVTKDNIEPLIKAAADLSIWTGKDLPATMKSLSLAISDPDKAMRLFRDANITLTDAEKDTLDGLNAIGDTAGITEFILTRLSEKGILGLGEAMADTGRGKFKIMQTAIGNLQESLGSGLLDSLGTVFDRITEFANDPKTIDFFTDIGASIGDFAETVINNLPSIMEAIQGLVDWLQANRPLIVGILAAIGVAMIAFAATAIEAGIAALAGLWPIIAVMALVGLAVALLYTAWTENWGGIQEATAEVWAAIQPIVNAVLEWLAVNVPIAIQALSDFWTGVLLPAIEAVFSWIVANLVPLFIELVNWLSVNVPLALQALSALWTGTLLPAIQAVWGWIQGNLIPLFVAISNLISTVLGVALTALAGLWQNILLPAIRSVWSFISANLLPIFTGIATVVTGTIMPALTPFADFLNNVLKAAIDGISQTISSLVGWIETLTDKIAAIKLPAELTPGSPTPFEIGLRGINDQLKDMARVSLPAVEQQMNVLASVRNVPGMPSNGISNTISNSNQSIKNYLIGAKFSVNSKAGLLEILNGLK